MLWIKAVVIGIVLSIGSGHRLPIGSPTIEEIELNGYRITNEAQGFQPKEIECIMSITETRKTITSYSQDSFVMEFSETSIIEAKGAGCEGKPLPIIPQSKQSIEPSLSRSQ